MNLYIISFIIILICVERIECRNANEFYTFRDAKATSIFIAPNNDLEKHGPNRAFQIGSSYWSSAGQHSDTEFGKVINFIEFSVMDRRALRESFNIANKHILGICSKGSYKENFKLDMPYETKFVRLTLRGAINTYFGIRHVHLVGYGSPLFMIKSGISSKDGEMCLQIEEGSTENQPRVVLDLCINAIAASDGRELWIQNSRQQIVSAVSNPPKCLTTVESTKHGPVILNDCNDDSCTWEFMGNSQLQVKNGNQLCLTQQDDNTSVAGMGNLVEKYKSDITVKSSGSSENHEEKFAVDLDKKTYWASLLFPDDGQHVSSLTIDFGKTVHSSRVVIDWEYQPLSYMIEASLDKITFKEISRNLSNASHTTTDSFPGTDFKQIRIVMLKPHYLHGVVSGGYVYGIRDVEVLTNNLLTIVGDCRSAANSADARDKYFVSYVSSFEPLLSKKITSMESDLHNLITDVSNELSHLRESLDESSNCMDEKKDYDNHIESIQKKEQNLWKLFNHTSKCESYEDDLHLNLLGDDKSNPAEDCYFIKNHNKNTKSGFYWIQPPCSKHPLRVYCDMDSLSSMLVLNNKNYSTQSLNNIRTPTSLRYQCASHGLEPLVIKSRHQIDELKKAINLMGFDKKLDSYVPLAYRFSANNKFKDFMNIFSFISLPAPENTIEVGVQGSVQNKPNNQEQNNSNELDSELHMNSIGLSMSTSEVEPFDLETSEISAIVCSTNATDQVTTPIELECGDIFGRSNKMYGSLNTNILVKCVQDCSNVENLYVYGTNGLYSDHSSVCLSAIHSGVIGSKGTFVVSIENGLKYYEGSKQNGVQSFYYNKSWHGLKDLVKEKENDNLEHNGPDCKYSIRILPLEKRCPVVETYGSFLQLPFTKNLSKISSVDSNLSEDLKSPEQNKNSQNTVDPNSVSNKTPESPETQTSQSNEPQSVEVKFDPNTIKYSNKVIDMMDSFYGVDNKTVTSVVEQIAIVVSKAKKHLRSLEPIYTKQNDVITKLFDSGSTLSTKVESYHDTLESNKNLYSNLLNDENSKSIDVSSDFKLDYRTMSFSKTFRVYDTSMTSGKSNWGYSDSPLEGHDSYVAESGDLDSEFMAEGSYAFLKHFKYFDFEASFDIMATNEGSFGIAFRSHDEFNFYLFEMNYQKSNKQLIKVENGLTYVLATNPDEGYNKNHWYNVKIKCRYYYIDIFVDDNFIFRTIDTSFLYGYFGLYSKGSNSSFYFDNIDIKVRNVQRVESPFRIERLKHIKCCNYSESFSGTLQDNYFIINPQYSLNTDWTYQELHDNNHKVIHQTKSSYDPLDLGSLLILKNDLYCKTGFLRFRILPQCESGTVGAVVHYKDQQNMFLVELNAKEFRVRHILNGIPKVLTKTEAKLSISKWNVIEIEINEQSIKARAKCNVEHNLLLKPFLSDYDYKVEVNIDSVKGHSVGLKSSSCESCYFDNFHVSYSHPKELNTSFLTESSSSAWSHCLLVNLLQRKRVCNIIGHGPNHEQCMTNFCEKCCDHHTRLMGDHYNKKCTEQCKKNKSLFVNNTLKFQSYLSSCTSLKGPGFQHCLGDKQCLIQSCRLCCNSGHYDQFQSIRSMESTYCENKCKILI